MLKEYNGQFLKYENQSSRTRNIIIPSDYITHDATGDWFVCVMLIYHLSPPTQIHLNLTIKVGRGESCGAIVLLIKVLDKLPPFLPPYFPSFFLPPSLLSFLPSLTRGRQEG